MSGVHANVVRKSSKKLSQSNSIICNLDPWTLRFRVLAIAIVIPKQQISLVAGSLQAFSFFVNAYGLNWLTPVIAILLAFGALGTLILGLLALVRVYWLRLKVETCLLFLQIESAWNACCASHSSSDCCNFISVFLFMPTVGGAYWILNATLVQIYPNYVCFDVCCSY